jgi:cobalt-zinc-cadmium efflux system membrane fusion protein
MIYRKRNFSRAVLPGICATFLILLAGLQPVSASSGRVVTITSQQMELLDIRTAPVRPATTQTIASVLGLIAPAPNSRIPVSAPFAGTLIQLIRLEGETVRKGDALATIASLDMQGAMAKIRGQEARSRTAKAAADRARALVKEGIAPASRAEEANAAAVTAEAELAASRALMSRAGSSTGGYRLLAPAAGRIASIAVSTGDQVAPMQLVLNIDIRQEFWVEASLTASVVGQVAVGDGVVLENMPALKGVVTAAGTSIDPHKRTATVRARLDAPASLVSGQTVRLSILHKALPGSFQIPRAALAELKSGPLVFVARPNGFEAVAVQLLSRGAQEVTVKGALKAGEDVAISGVSELKAAIIKD